MAAQTVLVSTETAQSSVEPITSAPVRTVSLEHSVNLVGEHCPLTPLWESWNKCFRMDCFYWLNGLNNSFDASSLTEKHFVSNKIYSYVLIGRFCNRGEWMQQLPLPERCYMRWWSGLLQVYLSSRLWGHLLPDQTEWVYVYWMRHTSSLS